MMSLDVTSLFTNISKELIMQGIEKRWDDFYTLLELSLIQLALGLKRNFLSKFMEALWIHRCPQF